MLVRTAATALAVVGAFVVASPPPAHADTALQGTYKLDFDGAHLTINDKPSPAPDTSASYSFTSSCSGDGCVTRATLLNTNDLESVSAHNPDLTLQFLDGAWKLSLPYDSPCQEGGERNQLLTWSLSPQPGTDVLTGFRIVATTGHGCVGDEPGPFVQPMTATRVGKPAPGVLPMP